MRAGSVFSGIGGGDLGMARAGIETVWQIENAKFPRRVLDARWPEVAHYDDVTRVGADELAAVDVLHGGFPCQDVSVAGRRAGLAGERSSLFFEFARLAAALRPRWVVIENVPGLRSSPESAPGADMAVVVGKLAELGYLGGYRSFDAQYFGLAQRRERVFFVGHLGDGARAVEVLFEPEGSGGDTASSGRAGLDITYTLTGRSAMAGSPERSDATVVIQDARGLRDKAQNGIGISEGDGPMYTLDGTSEHAVAVALRRNPGGVGQAWNTNYVAPTLRSNMTNNSNGGSDALANVYEPMGVRKLTPLECERLQGFPDGWTCLCEAEGVTALCTCLDSPRYKALGNAIAVPVMEWIAQRIVAVEESQHPQQ